MNNVYKPARIDGKLVAKNVATGSIAPESLIRYIQIRNAEKNGEVLVVIHISNFKLYLNIRKISVRVNLLHRKV